MKLCVVVVQVSSSQQHNADKSYKTKIKIYSTQFLFTQMNLWVGIFWEKETSGWFKKIWVEIYFGGPKNLCRIFFWPKTIWVGNVLSQILFWDGGLPVSTVSNLNLMLG